ncbi:MAG TPA: hypothetical protein VD968_03240, partial [Pyrinomonadaceae bacterium]|nr:hypothetical protein [Pyrinomonadaceae bacterium]
MISEDAFSMPGSAGPSPGAAPRLFSSLRRLAAHRPWLCAVAVPCAVLAAGVARDAAALLRYPAAVGLDGYYYVLQINALQQTGALHFPTGAPLVLYLMAGVGYLTGEPVLAVKTTGLLLHFALGLGVLALLRSLTRSPWPGALGAAMVSASSLRLYMTAEFVSNLGGLTFLVWAAWCALRYFRLRRRAWAAAALVLLAGGALSHRSILPLAASLALTSVFAQFFLAPARGRAARMVALLALAALWLSPAVLATQGLFDLPPRLAGAISATPRPPFDRYALAEEIILLLAAPLCILLIAKARPGAPGAAEVVIVSLALFSLLFTLNPFLNPQGGWVGLAGRARGLAYIQAALLVPGLLWLLWRRSRLLVLYAAAALVPLMLLSAAAPPPRGISRDYLAERSVLTETLPALRVDVAPNSIVVARHGDEFLVTALTGLPSQQTPPNDSPRYGTVYWLLHQAPPQTLDGSTIVLREGADGRFVGLLEDGRLRAKLGGLSDPERRRLFARNPHLRRAF